MSKNEWKNRIVGHGEENPDQLLANPRNWRTHPKEQKNALSGILKEVGYVQSVIVNKRTGYILDGHARVELAMAQGQPSIPVVYVDLSEDEEGLVLAVLDPIGAMAGADHTQLMQLLNEVQTEDPGLQALLDALIPDVGIDPEKGLIDDDDAPTVQVETVSKQGDVWLLEGHRVMCGDSTSIDQIGVLMGESKADMLFTDPPYGMSYEGGRGKKQFGMIKNDDAQGGDLVNLVRDAMTCAKTTSKEGAAAYVCFPWRTYAEFEAAIKSAGHDVSACIVWDKGSFGLGHQDYRPQHEFIFYSKGGAFYGDRSQSDVWYCKRDGHADYVHPTQKPVALSAKAIENSSKAGDTILDLFGGSGSTLIACQKLRRNARLMELDPKYCDVIVRRWQDFTGREAVLESTGQTFAEVEASSTGQTTAVNT